jgi:glycosyltransferase involved in cell wall biosynthesis
MLDRASKINVLLVNDHLGWNGTHLHGVGRYFLSIIPKFSEAFHIVPCILRKRDGLNKYFEERNIKIHYLERKKFDPRTLLDLLSIIKRENIHLMHLQGYAATTFGRIAGLISKVPVIIHQRDADPNHPRYMILPDRILSGYTDLGLAVSQYAKEFLAQKRKIPLDKIKALIDFVDIKQISLLDEAELEKIKMTINYNHGTKWIGMITRFYPVKGVDCLIKAIPNILSRHKDAKFVLCGDGPLLEDMKALARELKVSDRVLFPGFVDQPELWLSLFDIYASTSYSEGCGRSIMEAMVLGKPIVCTRSGGPEEYLKHGYSALMVETGDIENIAHSICQLLDNPYLRSTLSANAGAAAEQHDIDIYVRKLEGIYKEEIRNRSNKGIMQ